MFVSIHCAQLLHEKTIYSFARKEKKTKENSVIIPRINIIIRNI